MLLTLQLYTVRDQIAQDRRGTFEKIASFGIKYVEGGFVAADEVAGYQSDLEHAGLKMSGAHVGPDALENQIDEVIAQAGVFGYKYVIIPWIGEAVYSVGWDVLGKRFEGYGKKLAEHGLTLLYHNHDFEFKGGDHLQELYDNASPESLGAELDVAWVGIGGQDPVAYTAKLGDRVKLLHLKDYDPNTTPRWRPAGQGIVDLKGVIAAAPHVEFGAIELDESPADPLDAVRESADYLRSIGLE